MFEELGISGGTAILVLISLYFIIKWAVKNGVKEAYKEITGKEVKEDIDLILEKESKVAEKKNQKEENKHL